MKDIYCGDYNIVISDVIEIKNIKTQHTYIVSRSDYMACCEKYEGDSRPCEEKIRRLVEE